MPVVILVCVDGEPHSKGAIQWAVRLGVTLPAEVTALHVIDPFLKKFHNELYAQGRRQYLEYVDECLQEVAEKARVEYTAMCQSHGLETKFKVRRGEPIEEILKELQETSPHLLVTGGKPLSAWGRFRSRSLPKRVRKKAHASVPVLSVIDGDRF